MRTLLSGLALSCLSIAADLQAQPKDLYSEPPARRLAADPAQTRPSSIASTAETYGDLILAFQNDVQELKRENNELRELIERMRGQIQRLEESQRNCCHEKE